MDPSTDRMTSFRFDESHHYERFFKQSNELDNQIQSDFGDLV